MVAINIDTFNENLLLTQRYCSSQLLNTTKGSSEILRSINPVYNGKNAFDFEMDQGLNFKVTSWQPGISDSYDVVWLPDLFESQLIIKSKSVGELVSTNISGKILATELATVTDGASEAESRGFIDYLDLPPIDTWFYLLKAPVNNMLYSWVPEDFISLVEDAIQVNMLDLLYWVDNARDAENKLSRN